MRIARPNLATATICSLVGIIGIAAIIGAVINNASTSALSYSTSSDVSFTFAPTLSIGLSTDSLSIDNLVPGNISDSNSVKVTVSSNTPYGYVLSAGVGSSDSTSTYYNTSNLVHEDNTVNNAFTSIDTSASEETLTTDNTWGYSTSLDNGTTWSTYSGLPSTTTKPLLDISDPAQPSTIDFKIAAKSSTTQASGTYNNVITFYAVGKPEPKYLYEEVAKMSKGIQTAEDLQATITAPTSIDYREDTSNSGVYEYNSAVFGESSDASNANKIYYYRGVLEPEADQGEYGSDGKATTYPNYVRLDNGTCWRIVRTTGSGGVKMIYNGTWAGSTCANGGINAQIGTSIYNGNVQNMQVVGYTYSNKIAFNTTQTYALGDVLGVTGDDISTNTNQSAIKKYIEDWYSTNIANTNNDYTFSLEESAGYCNDRSIYRSSNTSQALLDSSIVKPYGRASGGQGMEVYYFGANIRIKTFESPSLTCPRGIVDIYSTSAGNGNGQLNYPLALLTADETKLAGSGEMSFIASGLRLGLLSPSMRNWGGAAQIFSYTAYGGIDSYNNTNTTLSVRPVISLKNNITATSGSGTATDPWVVPAP